jgi:predicted alpha/beta-hydrolase family hydrolase
MATAPFRIPVDHRAVESVRAVLDAPDVATDRSAVLLAHGAGAGMESPFLEAIARGLVERDHAVMRFDYPYMERAAREGRRRPPDPPSVLEDVHRRALDVLRERRPGARVLLAGKSMGGRMASRIAAKGAPCSGLVLLGYPLHPPRQPSAPRSEHFPSIAVPSLFLQGTRDDLCDLDLLRVALETYGGRVELALVEGADHDFDVPKKLGRSRSEVLAGLVETIARWERETFPA